MRGPVGQSADIRTMLFVGDAELGLVTSEFDARGLAYSAARSFGEAISQAPTSHAAVINVQRAAGRELAEGFRRFRPELAVITIGRGPDPELAARMLQLGVEDHLVAPLDMDVLVWRVSAVLIASVGLRPGSTHELRFEESTRTVSYAGRSTRLTPSEFRLVTSLAKQPGKVYSREEVIHRVWGTNSSNGERAVDALVSRLRRRLEDGVGLDADLIRTVRGVGYQLERRRPPRTLGS